MRMRAIRIKGLRFKTIDEIEKEGAAIQKTNRLHMYIIPAHPRLFWASPTRDSQIQPFQSGYFIDWNDRMEWEGYKYTFGSAQFTIEPE